MAPAEGEISVPVIGWQAREEILKLTGAGQARPASLLLRGMAESGLQLGALDQGEVADFLIRLVAAAIVLRDANNEEDALQLLQGILRLDAVFLPAHKEILIILILRQNRTGEALDHIYGAVGVREDEWILFWEAECYRRLGRLPQMVEVYRKIIPPKVWYFPFEGIWADICFDVARYSFELMQQLTAAWSRATWKNEGAERIFTPLLAGLLDPFGGSAVMFERQLKRALEAPMPGYDLHGALIQFVCDRLDNLDSANLAVFFHTVVSFCNEQAVRRFLGSPQRLAVMAHFPGFIKNFDLYVQRTGTFAAEFETCLAAFLCSPALEHFLGGDDTAFAFAESYTANVTALEIASRYRDRIALAKRGQVKFLPQAGRAAVELAGKRHLFVGVFGQMRSPLEAMAAQLQYLRKDLTAWRAAGHSVSFGFATWRETGAKNILRENRHFEYFNRLPQELAPFVDEQAFPTFSDFMHRFPQTGEKILKISRQIEEIDEAFLVQLFKDNGFDEAELFIDLKSEADFMADLGGRMHARFGDYTMVLNQGRMFHRIAAFAPMAALAEQKTGRAVTDFALIRPDVVFFEGAVQDLIYRAAAVGQEQSIYCDMDTNAQCVDGMGDRYFIGRTRPMRRLFETVDALSSMLTDSYWPYYKHRIKWHTLPRTILYESDVAVKSDLAGPKFYFHRARCKLEDVAGELAADIEHAPGERGGEMLARLKL